MHRNYSRTAMALGVALSWAMIDPSSLRAQGAGSSSMNAGVPANSSDAAPADTVLDGSDPTAFVGPWTVIVLDCAYNVERVMGADHAVTTNGERVGTWEIKDKQFWVHFSDGIGFDVFDLPARNGALRGKNKDDAPLSLIRQDAPVLPAARAQVVGTWDRSDLSINLQGPVSFASDGVYSYDGAPHGRWKIYGSTLLVTYDEHPEWTDIFELSATDDTMVGVNSLRNKLKLARRADAAPTVPPNASVGPSYFGNR